MYQTKIKYLNLEQIADSGQCFRWKQLEKTDFGSSYEIPAFHKKLVVTQQEDLFTFDCSEEEFQQVWREYLDLPGAYERYLESVDPEDRFLNAAAAYGSGIRILKQDPWEAAVSFLISQCNNIPRIKLCIEKLCHYFGEEGYHFPTADRLAHLKGEELELFRTGCSLGYRDEYILNFARIVNDGSFSLEECRSLSYKESVKKLQTVHGIGAKVADCIALYGLHQIDAFPLDVHMKQILDKQYFSEDLKPLSRKKQLEAMVERHFSRYEGYRGIVQQWIFAYELYCIRNKIEV